MASSGTVPLLVRDAVKKLSYQYAGRIKSYAPEALSRKALERKHERNYEERMYKTVKELACEKPIPLSLHQLYSFGKNPTPKQRLANACFLHRELPVRLSHRALELMSLPHGLSAVSGIQQVADCYALYAYELSRIPAPTSAAEEHEYSCLLAKLLLDAQSIPRALAAGLQDFRSSQGVDKRDGGWGGGGHDIGGGLSRAKVNNCHIGRDVENAITRFFNGRIGIRFLMEHHLSTLSEKPRPGWSGIIKSEVSPVRAAEEAAKVAREACFTHLGAAPEVIVRGQESKTFTYVPSHLDVMLAELLKNSCRAVVERHHPVYTSLARLVGAIGGWGKREQESARAQATRARTWPEGGPGMPPVVVTVAVGKEDVTIKIADEGGGARRSEMDVIWTYFFTTASEGLAGPIQGLTLGGGGSSEGTRARPSLDADGAEGDPTPHEPPPPLAGYGVGLPLSRVYARYFGGDLVLKSMEGFGMDSYLHLSRLGHNCENLPNPVRHSPAERDSTPDPDEQPGGDFE